MLHPKPMLVLLCAAALLLPGCVNTGPRKAADENAIQNERAITAAESAAEAQGAQNGESAPSLYADGTTIAAIQNEAEGLRALDYAPGFYLVFADRENPSDEDMTLVYENDEGEQTVVTEGLQGFGILQAAPDGGLYYNDFRTGIYLLHKDTGEMALWAQGNGYIFGPSWFADEENLYTTAHPEGKPPGEGDYQLVKIAWATGEAEILPDTEGVYPCDAFGDTLLYTLPGEEGEVQVYSYHTPTGKQQHLATLQEPCGDLHRGVQYMFEETADKGKTTLRAKNLVTGKQASAELDFTAEGWMAESIRQGSLMLYAYKSGQSYYFGLDFATGKISPQP